MVEPAAPPGADAGCAVAGVVAIEAAPGAGVVFITAPGRTPVPRVVVADIDDAAWFRTTGEGVLTAAGAVVVVVVVVVALAVLGTADGVANIAELSETAPTDPGVAAGTAPDTGGLVVEAGSLVAGDGEANTGGCVVPGEGVASVFWASFAGGTSSSPFCVDESGNPLDPVSVSVAEGTAAATVGVLPFWEAMGTGGVAVWTGCAGSEGRLGGSMAVASPTPENEAGNMAWSAVPVFLVPTGESGICLNNIQNRNVSKSLKTAFERRGIRGCICIPSMAIRFG